MSTLQPPLSCAPVEVLVLVLMGQVLVLVLVGQVLVLVLVLMV